MFNNSSIIQQVFILHSFCSLYSYAYGFSSFSDAIFTSSRLHFHSHSRLSASLKKSYQVLIQFFFRAERIKLPQLQEANSRLSYNYYIQIDKNIFRIFHNISVTGAILPIQLSISKVYVIIRNFIFSLQPSI